MSGNILKIIQSLLPIMYFYHVMLLSTDERRQSVVSWCQSGCFKSPCWPVSVFYKLFYSKTVYLFQKGLKNVRSSIYSFIAGRTILLCILAEKNVWTINRIDMFLRDHIPLFCRSCQSTDNRDVSVIRNFNPSVGALFLENRHSENKKRVLPENIHPRFRVLSGFHCLRLLHYEK